jgi:D,D-heptose 1,7-bisphosphate phosphatase
MEKLLRFDSKSLKGEAFAYNLGSDHGFSVLEIVKAAERVTQKKIRVRISDPRPGDPPRLVACSALAKAELGFVPQQSSIETILQSAWEWTKKSRVNGRAVFLDRDGTVNHDPGYLSHPDQFDLMPGVGPALKSLKDAGYKLILVSNQSGVGRGLIEKDNLFKIHTKLDQLLSQYQVSIDHIELCIHHPQEDCDCRKPKPKLILDAAKKMRVDVSQSFMVGDKATDVGAGLAAQCQGVALVLTGEGMQDQSKIDTQAGVFIAQDLAAAAKWILAARQP